MRKILILLLLCFGSAVHATVSDDLLRSLTQVKTMTADFKQVPLGQHSPLQHASIGTMALQRPNKFRWQIDKPNKQRIIADGVQLWYDNIDLQQVTVQKLSDQGDHSPARLLSGASQGMLSAYKIVKKNNWFILTAQKKNAQFKSLGLHFVNGELSQMQMTDNLTQQSQIEFSNRKINQPIAASLFSFTPDKDDDVIRK